MLNVTPLQPWRSQTPQTPAPLAMLCMAAWSQPWRAAASPASQAEQTRGALAGRDWGHVGGPHSCEGPSWASPHQTLLKHPQPPSVCVWVQGSTVELSWLVALALQRRRRPRALLLSPAACTVARLRRGELGSPCGSRERCWGESGRALPARQAGPGLGLLRLKAMSIGMGSHRRGGQHVSQPVP